jgi:hypothetical protein
MTSPELENLVRAGHLKREACSQRDFDNLVRSGIARLTDATNPAVSIEGRFDLAYNAAHALALAALRYRGYRSENRYVAFQALGFRGSRVQIPPSRLFTDPVSVGGSVATGTAAAGNT